MNTPAIYTVYLKRRAERELRNLPQNIRTRVDVRLEKLANNPRPPGVIKLSGEADSHWRIRVGEYRILYQIDDSRQLIEIYRIKHRRYAYRS